MYISHLNENTLSKEAIPKKKIEWTMRHLTALGRGRNPAIISRAERETA
jgi:hypothetical protein